MLFQLRELAIPVVGDALQGAGPELGSTCRKGGSTCVARDPHRHAMPEATPLVTRGAAFELVRRQIRESAT